MIHDAELFERLQRSVHSGQGISGASAWIAIAMSSPGTWPSVCTRAAITARRAVVMRTHRFRSVAMILHRVVGLNGTAR